MGRRQASLGTPVPRTSTMSALEVGDEAVAQLVLGGDRAVLQVQEPGVSPILESHGNQFAMTFSSPLAASMLSS